MKFFGRFILQIIANALAIALAAHFLTRVSFTGGLIDYLIIGLVLAIANLIIRPILKIISAPLIFITAGLFMIIINAIIIFGVDFFADELTIVGILGYLWVTLIIAVLNGIIVGAAKTKK